MYLDKNYILNSLTEDDIIHICTLLGSEGCKKDNNGNLIFQTVCHNADGGHYKLYYYKDTKKFCCYSGCHDTFSVIELVIRANRTKGKIITFYKALSWIGLVTGRLKEATPDEETGLYRSVDWGWLNKLKSAKDKHRRDIPSLSQINENVLEMFCYIPHEEWLKEHISREALSRFEIGYYGLTNQITIPHRDMEQRLIGIRGRNLDPDAIENQGKYLPLLIDGKFLSHQLGSNLYGAHVTKDAIIRTGKCLLLESEKGCLQNWSYFGDDSFAVATCGSNITTTQVRLLIEKLKVKEVIIGYDKEYDSSDTYEAELYYHKLLTKASAFMPYCKVSLLMDRQGLLDRQDAPTDKGKDVLLQLLEDKITLDKEDFREIKGRKGR